MLVDVTQFSQSFTFEILRSPQYKVRYFVLIHLELNPPNLRLVSSVFRVINYLGRMYVLSFS